MSPNTALLVIFSVLAVIGVAGIVLALTDKGLKWKNLPFSGINSGPRFHRTHLGYHFPSGQRFCPPV